MERVSVWDDGVFEEGTNTNCKPGEYGHKFMWRGYSPRVYKAARILSWRYDFTNAEITPEAIAWMEKHNVCQEVR